MVTALYPSSLLKKLDAALFKSRDSQSSIFFSPENVGLGEGFPSLLTSTDTGR